MKAIWQNVSVALRILRLLAMLSAVVVMTQQDNAKFVYGGF